MVLYRAESKYPQAIILLLDESGSMEDRYQGETFSKTDVVTAIINDLIDDLNGRCWDEEEEMFKSRFRLGIITYGSGRVHNVCEEKWGVPLASIHQTHEESGNCRQESRLSALEGLEIISENTWLNTDDLYIGGGTPMPLAFQEALRLVEDCLSNDPMFTTPGFSSYPMIVNITDGQPNGGFDANEFSDAFKATEAAMDDLGSFVLGGLSPKIFNVYVSDNETPRPVVFPSADVMPMELKDDTYGQWLWEETDPLPEELAEAANRLRGVYPLTGEEHSRKGFIWDATAEDLLKLLTWISEASTGAQGDR